jgi:hypothetical protein
LWRQQPRQRHKSHLVPCDESTMESLQCVKRTALAERRCRERKASRRCPPRKANQSARRLQLAVYACGQQGTYQAATSSADADAAPASSLKIRWTRARGIPIRRFRTRRFLKKTPHSTITRQHREHSGEHASRTSSSASCRACQGPLQPLCPPPRWVPARCCRCPCQRSQV